MFKLFLQHRINFDEVMIMRWTLSYSFMTPFCKKVIKMNFDSLFTLAVKKVTLIYFGIYKKSMDFLIPMFLIFRAQRVENGNRVASNASLLLHLSPV